MDSFYFILKPFRMSETVCRKYSSFYTDFVNYPTSCRLKFTRKVMTHDMLTSQYKNLLVSAARSAFAFMLRVLSLK